MFAGGYIHEKGVKYAHVESWVNWFLGAIPQTSKAGTGFAKIIDIDEHNITRSDSDEDLETSVVAKQKNAGKVDADKDRGQF